MHQVCSNALEIDIELINEVVYVFLVLISLVEVAIASWLVIQYGFRNNYPRDAVRNGISFLLYVTSN